MIRIFQRGLREVRLFRLPDLLDLRPYHKSCLTGIDDLGILWQHVSWPYQGIRVFPGGLLDHKVQPGQGQPVDHLVFS